MDSINNTMCIRNDGKPLFIIHDMKTIPNNALFQELIFKFPYISIDIDWDGANGVYDGDYELHVGDWWITFTIQVSATRIIERGNYFMEETISVSSIAETIVDITGLWYDGCNYPFTEREWNNLVDEIENCIEIQN